ncbi:hypothetical protein ACLMJK_009185 [Lecanora helva]
MEQRKPPQYILEVFADPTCVKDIVRGILHTIFFHRYFPSIKPSFVEVLDFTLPLVADPELETLIDTRVGQLFRQLSSNSSPKSSVRGSLVVEFFEKKRRKAAGLGWFGTKGDEEICWESWCLEVTLATPKTEIGNLLLCKRCYKSGTTNAFAERTKVVKAVGSSLQKTAMKIITIVNRDKDHIPPITTSETNPFPYHIDLNPRVEGWGRNMGIF